MSNPNGDGISLKYRIDPGTSKADRGGYRVQSMLEEDRVYAAPSRPIGGPMGSLCPVLPWLLTHAVPKLELLIY